MAWGTLRPPEPGRKVDHCALGLSSHPTGRLLKEWQEEVRVRCLQLVTEERGSPAWEEGALPPARRQLIHNELFLGQEGRVE